MTTAPPSSLPAPPAPFAFTGDEAAAFEAALRAAVAGEVRFDAGSRAMYAADASNYRQVPIAVVVPRDVRDVEAALAVCRRFGVPVLPRGGGTSQCGQAVNVAV
ncbi:MAG: FAD-binding protein, partial [Burkholderiaceae bacterium]